MDVWNIEDKKKELKLIKETVALLQVFKNKYKDQVNHQTLDDMLRSTFSSFSRNYEPIYKMVLKTDDMTMLNEMINNIYDICDGKKELEDVRKDFGDKLAEKYLYPAMGKPKDNKKKKK
jgi:hypothetical protein